jgi:hypothetical protein
MHKPLDPITVSAKLLEPVFTLLPTCQATRSCPSLADEHGFKLCLARILHDCSSGRALLQQYGSAPPNCPEVGAYFESLKSARRLALVQELNAKQQTQLARESLRPLHDLPPLKDFECFAGDGHWHGAAAHDPAVQGTKFGRGHSSAQALREEGLGQQPEAEQARALWLCLAHNCLVLLEVRALIPSGVANRAEDRRCRQRLDKARASATSSRPVPLCLNRWKRRSNALRSASDSSAGCEPISSRQSA